MLEILCDLAQVNNAHRQAALEELAKHYEHNEKNAALALEMTESALGVAPSLELLHRKSRLEKRLLRQAKGKGLF